MTHEEISTERWKLSKARMDKMRDAMEEYDRTVYYPAVGKLQEECTALGHVRGKFHDNGIGTCWFYCAACGAIFDKEKTCD